MPDIMMCAADNCPLSPRCRRHADSGTKPDPHMQSWWARVEGDPVGYECGFYWQWVQRHD